MMKRRRELSPLGMVLGVGLVLSMTGCDYWPPALQAQIEQLRSDTQTLTMEKTQLQIQVNDLSKAKQEMQAQLDELSRINREKTSMIMSLQHQLDALRAKVAKAPAKKPTKATTKSAAKQPVKTKPPKKR
jgi:chromosome segregation ATPase